MKFSGLLLTVALSCHLATAVAAEPPKKAEQQTSWGLYVDAKEAYQMKTSAEGKSVLFVDVRDPIEIMFTGFTDVVDINIPFMTAVPAEWNDKRSNFMMELNDHFEKMIAQALTDRGLSKDAAIILMCRSGGERGAPSAKLLEGKGYKQVYVVVDGFEGGTIADGEKKNWRLVNGWKNAGLPWSYKLNEKKMFIAHH